MDTSKSYHHLYQKYKSRYFSQVAGAKGAKGVKSGCGLNTNNPSGRRTCVRLDGRVAKNWKITENSPDCEEAGNRCRLRYKAGKTSGLMPVGKKPTGKEPTGKKPTGKKPTGKKAPGKEATKKPRASKSRNAKFHDIAGDVFGEDYDVHGYITHEMVDAADGAHGGDAVKAYLRGHSDEIYPGDIIYVGSTSEGDLELGFGIVIDAKTGTWVDTDTMPPVDLPFRRRGVGVPGDVIPILQREGVKYRSLFNQLGNKDVQGRFSNHLGFYFLEGVEQRPSGEWEVVDRYRAAGIWE